MKNEGNIVIGKLSKNVFVFDQNRLIKNGFLFVDTHQQQGHDHVHIPQDVVVVHRHTHQYEEVFHDHDLIQDQITKKNRTNAN